MNATLAGRINQLQEERKKLKKKVPLDYREVEKSKVSAIKAVNKACSENKENLNRRELTRDQTAALCKILLSNDLNDIDNVSDSSYIYESYRNPYIESLEESRSEIVEENIPIEVQSMMEKQEAKIRALARRNMFLEARHEQEVPKVNYNNTARAIKLYAEIKSRCKEPTKKEGFEGYCYNRIKEMNKTSRVKGFSSFIHSKLKH